VTKGDIAEENGRGSVANTNYGHSGSCNSYGSFSNCNARANSGGFWGSFADGIAKNIAGSRSRKSALKSCLAQYGWRQ